MFKRTLSGAVYLLIVLGFFLLREYVDYRCFNLLIWFFSAMGTYEVARAVKKKIFYGTYLSAIIFGLAFIPVCFTVDVFGKGKVIAFCVYLLILVSVIFISALLDGRRSHGAVFYNVLPFIYPSLFLLTTYFINGNENGFLGLLLLFVISPSSDVFAYLVGITYNKIRKGNAKKLCPNLSPKKTVAGAIGGLIGGILGSIVIYVLLKPETAIDFPPLLLFALIGLFAGFLTEAGDLFESLIKRRVHLKDMGKIMPGHGGVMDRTDGMLFASVFIYFILIFFL